MPFNYTTLDMVQSELIGLDISDLPSTLLSRITSDFIPAAKVETDTYCSENFDLTRVREFYDGNNLPNLPLRHKPIHQIDVVTMRIVPSLKWFFFQRWFYIKTISHDGVQVAPDGGVAPTNPPYEPLWETPYTYLVGSGLTPIVVSGNTAVFSNSTATYEASDLHVDAVNGVLTIPPRVLFIEAQGVPFFNYTWIMGQRNIEVDYYYGYTDIAHLPYGIQRANAKLVAAKVLQMKAMWVSSGTKSLNHDGVNKNFGDGAYSTEIKALKEEAYAILNRYKRITV